MLASCAVEKPHVTLVGPPQTQIPNASWPVSNVDLNLQVSEKSPHVSGPT